MNHIFQKSMKLIVCVSIGKRSSSQASILINSCTELSKTQFFKASEKGKRVLMVLNTSPFFRNVFL